MMKMRYLGGGLGLIPSPFRNLLVSPLGFVRPEISVRRRLEGTHTAASAAHHHDPVDPRSGKPCGFTGSWICRGPLPFDDAEGLGAQVGGRVATHPVAERSDGLRWSAALSKGTSAAERVGLVEEHHHTPVAQGQFAELPEQTLDLQDADPHEHGLEGARIDEHEGEADLTGGGLGDEGFPRSRGTPQQDPAGYIAALGFDLIRFLEEPDVLPNQLEHMVLTPDVGVPSLDLLRA